MDADAADRRGESDGRRQAGAQERTNRTDLLTVRPDVFSVPPFGASLYPVKEAALVGGEDVRFQTDATGAV